MQQLISEKFLTIFGKTPVCIVRSPGRVNLIGEHTDYNMGLVLPAAIDYAIWLAASPRADDLCNFYSLDLSENFSCSLQKLERNTEKTWANYPLGVVHEIQKLGKIVGGFDLLFGGNLPIGSGLSSSAALENGVGMVLNKLYNFELSTLDLVKISHNAENNFVGMRCGIMDMFVSMMGKKDHVILLDCRDLFFKQVPLHFDGWSFLLCDTGIKHQLANSEYNTRRMHCEEGVAFFKNIDPAIGSLREVSIGMLLQHKKKMLPLTFKRCKYVIEEIRRVEKAVSALQRKDLSVFGKLMFESHNGLNEDFEVSCPELNFLVDQARRSPDCLGARMMGGGFGGCTINLVKTAAIPNFSQNLTAAYLRIFKNTMLTYPIQFTDGTSVVVG